MPNEHREFLSLASEYWRDGKLRETGRLIFENLSPEVRPKWALRILQLVVKRSGVKIPPIDNILHLARDPSEWNKAHDAFSWAREWALELNGVKNRSAEQALLLRHLVLAEIVAKVIYNATDPPDEFDETSGWWIAECLKHILDLLNDDKFSQRMWSALCFRDSEDILSE